MLKQVQHDDDEKRETRNGVLRQAYFGRLNTMQ